MTDEKRRKPRRAGGGSTGEAARDAADAATTTEGLTPLPHVSDPVWTTAGLHTDVAAVVGFPSEESASSALSARAAAPPNGARSDKVAASAVPLVAPRVETAASASTPSSAASRPEPATPAVVPPPTAAAEAGCRVRVARIHRYLGVNPLSLEILRLLYRVLQEASASIEANAAPSPFADTLSWRYLRTLAPLGADGQLRVAVMALAHWGLIQVLGAGRNDPQPPGSVAIRLTAWGKDCLDGGPGLEALGLPDPRDPAPTPVPWRIIHASSHGTAWHRLLQELAWPASAPALRPIRPDRVRGEESIELERTCGRVTNQLFYNGIAVVDAHSRGGTAEAIPWLEDLLTRTASAPGIRVLLIDDPAPLRYAATSTGASLISARAGGTTHES